MNAQVDKVSRMQAQHTQSDTIAGLISKSNTFMQCYGEISSGWGYDERYKYTGK